MKRLMAGLALAIGLGGGAAAQDATLADVGLQQRIEVLSQDADAHGFELGMLSALRAVERTLQTRYAHGMGDRLMALPMLRLDLGVSNPQPTAATPETLSQLMQAVLDDLETARSHLDAAADADAIAPFTMTLQDIWFDVNSNGRADEGESAFLALGPLLLGRRAASDITEGGTLSTPLTVRFDVADHAWLTAYTHMLSGFGNLFLAFDPGPVFQRLEDQRAILANAPTIANTFDPDALSAEIAGLEQEDQRLQAALDTIREGHRALTEERNALLEAETRDNAAVARINKEINRIRAEEMSPLMQQQRAIRAEIAAAEAKLYGGAENELDMFRNDVDAVYVLLAALRQQPDAARIAATRDHWLQVIAHNKVFWAALAQETDNDNEWIPNPAQTSALPLRVSAEMAQGWQAILEDAQALLEGRLLVPHPLLPEGTGISLKAYAEDPAPLDLLEWVHGIGAYRYAAKGPMVTRQRWFAFQRLTRGNAGGFALFFN